CPLKPACPAGGGFFVDLPTLPHYRKLEARRTLASAFSFAGDFPCNSGWKCCWKSWKATSARRTPCGRFGPVDVLERIGNAEAKKLLEALARNQEDRAGQEAKSALERLAKKPPATP